jgi:hypothetical protein
MANSLSIRTDADRIRVFLCPACKETIALGCERCRFCSVSIDQQAAQAAADLMDRVNLACSEAEDIRALFPWQATALGLASERRQGIDLYLLPFLLARWWVRYGSLKLEDEDLARARKDLTLYSWLVALALAIGLGAIIVGLSGRK